MRFVNLSHLDEVEANRGTLSFGTLEREIPSLFLTAAQVVGASNASPCGAQLSYSEGNIASSIELIKGLFQEVALHR